MGYAPSFTPRYIARYQAAGKPHNIQVRGYLGESQGITEARALPALHDLFAALAPGLADDFVWLSAKYIPEDSESFVPSAVPVAVTGTVPVGTFSKQDRISPIHFPGKCTTTVGGLFVFGIQWNPDQTPDDKSSDFIITAEEDTNVAAAIAVLNGARLPGIDGTILSFYNYVTYKPNDFYVKRTRKGT